MLRGYLEQGHLGSLPANLLQSVGHRTLNGSVTQSGGHLGSVLLFLAQSGGQLGCRGFKLQGHLGSLAVYLSQSAGHLLLKGSRSQSGAHRGSSSPKRAQSGGQFLLKGFLLHGHLGSLPANRVQFAGQRMLKGSTLQSGGHRGSWFLNLEQSGGQFGCVGFLLHGHRSSFPVNC